VTFPFPEYLTQEPEKSLSDSPEPGTQVWCRCPEINISTEMVVAGAEIDSLSGPAKRELTYEANPIVNCDEPEVVFGTSLAYIVYIPVGMVLSVLYRKLHV
jgi:hypothetical protein